MARIPVSSKPSFSRAHAPGSGIVRGMSRPGLDSRNVLWAVCKARSVRAVTVPEDPNPRCLLRTTCGHVLCGFDGNHVVKTTNPHTASSCTPARRLSSSCLANRFSGGTTNAHVTELESNIGGSALPNPAGPTMCQQIHHCMADQNHGINSISDVERRADLLGAAGIAEESPESSSQCSREVSS
jgi:hypothetical protein